MSSPPPTDWSFEPTDAEDADGRKVVVPWAAPMDAAVAIDLTSALATGEAPTNVTATLWRLKAYGEADHTDVTGDVPDKLPGDPVIAGNVVSQRVANLARGRTYRIYFTWGAAGNRRSRSIVIDVSDNS